MVLYLTRRERRPYIDQLWASPLLRQVGPSRACPPTRADHGYIACAVQSELDIKNVNEEWHLA
eukprot:13924981-Alexandrium_andersonii.AAC.1